MAIDNLSYNPDEYYIGKGIVTIQPVGDTVWYDVGNVPEFEFTPNVEELEHRASRSGVRVTDKTVLLEKGGELRIVMEEWTSFNLAIILLADETVTADSPEIGVDLHELDILSKSQYSAAVRFQGQNDIGPRWNFQYNRVDFRPSGSLNPISEEWGGIEITGRLAATDVGGVLKFGTARRVSDGRSPGWPA